MKYKNTMRSLIALISLTFIGFTAPVLAHHPMGGQTPDTVWQGLLSGLGHPVIELDHLAFLIGLALLTSLVDHGRRRLIVPFVATSLLGAFLHTKGIHLPLPEMWIGVSLLVVAGLLLFRLQVNAGVAFVFCIFAGLMHGYAFGEAIVGARTSALLSYLVGLGVIQCAMLWIVATSAQHIVPTLKKAIFIAAGAASAVLGVYALAGL